MQQTFSFLTGHQYEAALLAQIPNTNDRIVIMVMAMTWGPRTARLLALIQEAQQRGVKVTLLYDRFSYLPFSFPRPWPWVVWPSVRRFKSAVTHLIAQGSVVHRVGSSVALNPFAGRQHAKIAVIDEQVYSFGGVNFTDSSFDYTDYMLGAAQGRLADQLVALVGSIGDRPQADQRILLSQGNYLLFDGGNRGGSIIFERATALARDAKRIYYISQMCPSGQLATVLRGKAVCYFNRPLQTSFPANIGMIIDQLRFRVKNAYAGQEYIHAKYILFEMNDGTKRLVSGSNNFSWRGVAFGTKEIALESDDVQLWARLYEFFIDKIKQ